MGDYKEYSPAVMRIILGLLFVLPGFDKVMSLATTGGHMVTDLLWASVPLAWFLGLLELVCGLAILIGWKVRYAAWPMAVVLIGAMVLAVWPTSAENPMWMIMSLFHLLGAAALVHLAVTGSGPMGVDKE